MGQNYSLEEGESHREEENIKVVEENGVPRRLKHIKHNIYSSNGDLESAGDIDSIIQAMNVSPVTPDSEGLL